MIHCTPVAESERSFWIVGIAIATIVWSMKVIETAKIIAARMSLLFLPLDSLMTVRLPPGAESCLRAGADGKSARTKIHPVG